MGSAVAAAPWDAVPSHEQLFVLITGANSGVGLGIGERLIDEFLATRSLNAHLVILPTTRSKTKSLQTIQSLRAHVVRAAQTSTSLRSRAGESYRWQDTVRRVHILSLQLDLCDIRGVHALAERLVHGTVSNPEGLEGEYLRDVKVPRLDSVVCNAGYGGWSGLNYVGVAVEILTKGIVQSVTWPMFKVAFPTRILNAQPEYDYPPKPLLGEVFSACLFGHYILAHQLLPLLSRSSPSDTPGRIIWSGSLEAMRSLFDFDDMQGLRSKAPYESAKRLTEILSLTATLPAARPFATPFLTPDDPETARAKPHPPKHYLTHPGIVLSTFFPVPWYLVWAYGLILAFSRFIGSPWHTIDWYSASKAAAWVALEDQPALDELDAEKIKWGSSSNRHLEVQVKKTEVDDWGWEGRIESEEEVKADPAQGVFKKTAGRRKGSTYVTDNELVEFEELGAKCWKAMEALRHEWEDILGFRKA